MAPFVAGRWVRWCLRSRVRAGGLLGMVYMAYEALSYFGFYDYVRQRTSDMMRAYQTAKEVWTESSETVAEAVAAVEGAYAALKAVIEPWRIVALLGTALLLYRFWEDVSGEDSGGSPTSSAAGTPSGSPGTTPPETPRASDPALATMAQAFERQGLLLSRMVEKQEALEEKLADLADERTASDYVKAARGDSGGGELWSALSKRLEDFEGLLRADQRGADHGAGASAAHDAGAGPHAPQNGASGSTDRDARVGLLPSSGESPQRQAGIQEVINKLRRTAERPNEKFIQALGEFEETDFSSYFPVGFRERVAPSWLGEVYSTGVTGKEYAKTFVRDRQLGENGEARELIPVMTAIDTILLQDRKPGAINTIALEMLAKKGLGIVSAFRAVETKDHWRKPANGGKTWKSRVDEEMWRRIDPVRGGQDELQYSNRKLEEEIRGEVDRDAQMLKAFSKLEERRKATESQ